ncbi:MAG: hypothetical protein EP330_18150 [Deltaproteobacteria bacterium]|nr:MAG: hypothetical protein EP330_18150 [Deltaproteobacteria bacterium]
MRRTVLLLAIAGCSGAEPADGLLDDGLYNPFPAPNHIVDGHVSLDASRVPTPDGGAPMPVDRLAFRTGFSRGQTAVVWLDDVDASALPSWREPTPGEGGVVLYDLTDGRFIPVFAELDAHPDAVERPALLVRPLESLAPGHEVAVVVRTSAAERPESFQRLLDRPHRDDRTLSDDLHETLDAVAAAGIDDVAVAWSFPVGDRMTSPLTSALDQVSLDGAYTIDVQRIAADGDRVGPFTARSGEGTFTVQNFLVDDQFLDLQADGTVSAPVGTAQAELWVHVPESVLGADPGTVPVMIFGHGIFGQPSNYLGTSDTSAVLRVANDLGAIVVGTVWRGLEADGRLDALEVAGDFGQFPLITDRLVQAHVNQKTLLSLVRDGDLLDDPFFLGLADPDTVVYYGISLGGIEGQVFMAQHPPVEAAVLHVPGGVWSTMLERSTQWPIFELVMDEAVPSPHDRQLLYAFSQLFWDPVDPVSWTEEFGSELVLLQESIGDEQVPNMTTELLARSAGLPILEPYVRLPYDLETTGDLPSGGAALVQFDTLYAEPLDVNRPPALTGAHQDARLFPGASAQTVEFLTPGQFGKVTHFCGANPCTTDNDGSAR